MSPNISTNPVVSELTAPHPKDSLIEMLLENQLPLTEEEKLECLAHVGENKMFRTRAFAMLGELTLSTKIKYAETKNGSLKVARYLLWEAMRKNNIELLRKIIQNQSYPENFLVFIAEKGSREMLEALLENQIKLIAFPEIIEKMEKSPRADNFILGKISEIRSFYLNDRNIAPIEDETLLDEVKEVIAEESGSESDSLEMDSDDLQSLIQEKALSSLQRINQMSVAERVKLALTGTKSERTILIKDSNRMVSMAVIESPKISEDEVILIIRNRSIGGEIISKISQNRDWTKNYNIVIELLNNPKTPVKNSLGFIKKLHIRDLKYLARNKNTSPVTRTMAANLLKQKEK